MIYLRINTAGMYQPHQCADGAHIAITGAEGKDVAGVARLANITMIITTYQKTPVEIQFASLGYGKVINLL